MIERTIPGSQGALAVLDFGEPAGTTLPVVFLHADAGRAQQWAEQARRLAPERRAIAFDFRGNGASAPARDRDYGYAGRAEDIASVVDALGVRRFALVAHSGGGAVALAYAAAHPERVAGVLLIDPPTDPRALPAEVRDGFVADLAGPRSLEALKTYYASIAGTNPVVRDRVLADCDAVDPAARAGLGAALAAWNPEPALDGWRGPIAIVATPANAGAHALYVLRPAIPHQIIGDAGHWVQLDQPDAVARAVRGFVSGLPGERD